MSSLIHTNMYRQDSLGAQQKKKNHLQRRRPRRHGFNPWLRKIPWRRAWASLVAQTVKKNLSSMQKTWVWLPGWEDPWRRKWLPTPVFLSGEFPRQKNHGVAKSQTQQSTIHTHICIYVLFIFVCVCVCLLLKFSNLLFPLSQFPPLWSCFQFIYDSCAT